MGVIIAASSSCVLVFVFQSYIKPTGVLLMLMGRSDSCSFQINHKVLLICVITGPTLASEVGRCGVFPVSSFIWISQVRVHLHREQSQDMLVPLSCPPFLKTSPPPPHPYVLLHCTSPIFWEKGNFCRPKETQNAAQGKRWKKCVKETEIQLQEARRKQVPIKRYYWKKSK